MELTIEQALQQGVAAHQEGKLQKAERLYRAILQSQPLHPDANHNLGVLAVSVNEVELALPLFKRALEANPKIEQSWLSYIDALIKKHQLETATTVLEEGRKVGLVGDKVDFLEAQLKQITQSVLPKSPEKKKSLTVRKKHKKIAASKQKKMQAKGKHANSVSHSESQVDDLLEHYQNGRYNEAEKLAIIITQKFPKYQFGWKALGALLKQAGRLNESLVASQKSVQLAPQDAEAHSNLGFTLQELGRLEEAEASLRQAIILKPDFIEAHSNLGNTLNELSHQTTNSGMKQSRLEESLASHTKVILLNHDFAEAHSNLGSTLKELDRLDEAEESCRKAIALKPDLAEAHNNLGIALQKLGRLGEAEASFMQVLVLIPDHAEAHNNLGITLTEQGKLVEAELTLRQAIVLKADSAEAHNNLGTTLEELLRYEEAEASYRQAIVLQPGWGETHRNLGGSLQQRGLGAQAMDCFLKAISLNPDSVSYRWMFTICQLPKIYLTHEDLKKSLHKFEVELNKLQEYITAERLNETVKAIGNPYPYYLAYVEKNNKHLLKKHGEICHRVMSYWYDKNLMSTTNPITKHDTGRRIKIGIVSDHIRYHSVWNAFLKGVVKNLDPEKFEVHIFSLSNKFDDETDVAKANVAYFNVGKRSLKQWASKIINSEVDIIFYPEIGMNQQTIQLASMRLASVQVCSWGHPETSGLRTIDYYISSELLETSNSDRFYTEKLVKLPGLGVYFDPPTLESSDIDFIQIELSKSSPKLLCLGAPNKFSPTHDWVFVEIIRRLGDCQFVFMSDEHGASKILERRIKTLIEDAGFVFDKHVVFVPQQSRQGYSALMQSADLLLDTIGFSGFNTAMQAIACGLPVITREGRLQRTKHASAILRTIEVEELITETETEYIDLVEKLILDQELLYSIKSKIKQNENYLYRNKNAIRALENFFEGCIFE